MLIFVAKIVFKNLDSLSENPAILVQRDDPCRLVNLGSSDDILQDCLVYGQLMPLLPLSACTHFSHHALLL